MIKRTEKAKVKAAKRGKKAQKGGGTKKLEAKIKKLEGETGARIKGFKNKLIYYEKDLLDARASREYDKSIKLENKIGREKGKISYEQRRFEKKLAALYRKLQKKEVRQRMKQSKNEANRVNENKREFFFKRWFRKK